jgi:hypothetical protein
VVKARSGFVGNSGCEVEIASAQPNGIVLSFIVIAAEPRNDGAFDGWFWFDLLPSRTVPVWRVASEDGPGLTCCLRGRSLVKVPSEAARN